MVPPATVFHNIRENIILWSLFVPHSVRLCALPDTSRNPMASNGCPKTNSLRYEVSPANNETPSVKSNASTRIHPVIVNRIVNAHVLHLNLTIYSKFRKYAHISMNSNPAHALAGEVLRCTPPNAICIPNLANVKLEARNLPK